MSHTGELVERHITNLHKQWPLKLSVSPHCSNRECPAEELPFANGEVDLVTAMTAAHWFDRQRFLQEADRVLRPGGCLALLSYTMDMKLEYGDISDSLNDICEEVHIKQHHDALF